MTERPADVPDNNNHDMILGELRGQQRELIHSVNNLGQKFDALAREVSALGSLAVQVAELKTADAALEVRLVALETERNRREGAQGLLHTMLKSPVVGWMAAAAALVTAYVKGWLHL